MLLEQICSSDPKDRFVMVIDGGSAEPDEYKDNSSGRLPLDAYMRESGFDHVDCMVLTHIHEDHLCGLLPVAEHFSVGELWQSLPDDFYKMMQPEVRVPADANASRRKMAAALSDYGKLCALIEGRGGTIRQTSCGDEREIAQGCRVRVLGPDISKQKALRDRIQDLYAAYTIEKIEYADAHMNNHSIILQIKTDTATILLPGDTNREGYGDITPADLKADIFKTGHHGQRDALSTELVEQIRPKLTVCCASSDRRYNSAHPDILRMLTAAGSELAFSDCPALPPEMEPVPPHHALVIEINENGIISREYR